MNIYEKYILQHFNYNDGKITRDDRKNSNGSIDKDGYLIIKVKGKQFKAHRIVWLLYYGYFPKSELDHINRNKLDNRIENLRESNRSEQNKNKNKMPNKETGQIGIYIDKTKGLKKNYATKINNKTYRFYTLQEAIEWRKKMDYKDLKEINNKLKTIDVKGKNYVEVNERIKAFREICPNGSIETNIEHLENGVVVMSCIIKDENSKILSKAHAYEKENSTFINKTSFIENCCTSATGRALGYLGIGIDTSVASAEEVQNAIIQQDDNKKISKTQVEALNKSIENANISDEIVEIILGQYGYGSTNEIKVKDYTNIINDFKSKK